MYIDKPKMFLNGQTRINWHREHLYFSTLNRLIFAISYRLQCLFVKIWLLFWRSAKEREEWTFWWVILRRNFCHFYRFLHLYRRTNLSLIVVTYWLLINTHFIVLTDVYFWLIRGILFEEICQFNIFTPNSQTRSSIDPILHMRR